MGCIYKQRKSRFWWIKYSCNGRQIRESTGTEKASEARRILRQREGEVAAGRPILPRAHRVRFDELAEDFLTDYRINGKRSLIRVRYSVRRLHARFGGWLAAHIGTPAIRDYIQKRQEEGAANATINRELAALKRMFTLAIQAETLHRRPHIPRLLEDNIRQGFFSEVDFLALQEALPEYLRLVASFAYITGWRKGEILNLTWEGVSLDEGTVRLEPGTTKNREGRTIVMPSALRDLLSAQWQRTCALVQGWSPGATPREVAASVPWVFHRGGRPIRNYDLAWRNACVRAGLPGRLFHDLRRTAIRNMVRAGIPERVAMMISGHKTRSVFDRYNIVSEADLRAAADRLTPAGTGILAGIPCGSARCGTETL